jgi:hypothetical protein
MDAMLSSISSLKRAGAVATLLAGLGLVACGPGPKAPPEGAILPFEEVLSIQNAMTGIETPTHTLILDPEAWAAAWAAIFANYAPGQKPSLPPIDFQSRVIVLAAAGFRGATGFSFTIKEVRFREGLLPVLVLEEWPPWCGSLPAPSAPVHVVSIPRASTTAEFTVTTKAPSCT